MNNGEEVGPFPSHRIEVSDKVISSPAQSFYFMCGGALSSSLKVLERRGFIHGCKVARGAPVISHLLFADDSYLFFKASPDKNILHCYI